MKQFAVLSFILLLFLTFDKTDLMMKYKSRATAEKNVIRRKNFLMFFMFVDMTLGLEKFRNLSF